MIVGPGLDSDSVPTKTIHRLVEAAGCLMTQTGHPPAVYYSATRINLHFVAGLTVGSSIGLLATREDLRPAIEMTGFQVSFRSVAADYLYSAVQINPQLGWL